MGRQTGAVVLVKALKLCYDVLCAVNRGVSPHCIPAHVQTRFKVYEWKGMAIIMYKYCIFDLDGTLVNSIHAIKRSVDLTLVKWGMRQVSEDECKVFVGDGYKKLLERALKACGDEELARYGEAVERYPDIFRGCCLYQVEAYDGIGELLGFLKEHGIRAGVLSNKPHERALENVESVFGTGCFDLVYGEREDMGIQKKPAPDGLWAMMEELGAPKEEVLYLGDTNTDMRTGKSAGVDTAGVTWGFRDRKELEMYGPRFIASHPSQVIQIIKDVNGIG